MILFVPNSVATNQNRSGASCSIVGLVLKNLSALTNSSFLSLNKSAHLFSGVCTSGSPKFTVQCSDLFLFVNWNSVSHGEGIKVKLCREPSTNFKK